MKKTILSFCIIILTAGMINAQVDRHRNTRGNGHTTRTNGEGIGHTRQGVSSSARTVNAPLDGGLLLVLGGAGAAYYAARKRRKES